MMIWYAVIGVSAIAGYLVGFNRGQSGIRSQYERVMKDQQLQYEANLTHLRAIVASLETDVESLRRVNEVQEQLHTFKVEVDMPTNTEGGAK